jgi:hypothetical protein
MHMPSMVLNTVCQYGPICRADWAGKSWGYLRTHGAERMGMRRLYRDLSCWRVFKGEFKAKGTLFCRR